MAGLAFALLALLVVLEWAPLMEFDSAVVDSAVDLSREHDTYRDVMKTATWLLNSGPVLIYAAAVAIGLTLAKRSGAALWLTGVVGVGLPLNPLLKQIFQRERPRVPDPVETFSGLSFPSGHAAGAALLSAALALVFWARCQRNGRIALIGTVVALSLLCGWTRMTLGGHYPSDVLGGTLWALAWVAAWHSRLPWMERVFSERASRRR